MKSVKPRHPARTRRARLAALSLSLRMDDPAWRKDAEALRLIRHAARLALREASASPAATTLCLTSDEAMRALNAQFRSKNRPTNVLSFPSSEEGAYLGDVAIAFGTVAREAKDQKKRFSDHAAHLAVHGVLHLLGFDHESETEAAEMEDLETRLLAQLGIDDPYRRRPEKNRRPYKKRRKAVH